MSVSTRNQPTSLDTRTQCRVVRGTTPPAMYPPRHIQHFRGRGFTLIELLVASVIVSVALLGVFSLMRQASQVEARSQEVWRSRGRAEAVADHLVHALQHAVVVSNPPTGPAEGSEADDPGGIQAGLDDSGAFRLRLFVLGGVYDHGQGEPTGGTRWIEYRWYRENQADQDGVVTRATESLRRELSVDESTPGYVVELRSVLLAGDVLLQVENSPGGGNAGEGVDWGRIDPIVLATGLDQIDIAFQQLPDGDWQPEYEGPPADVLIRLRVRVADETIERVIYARAMPAPSASANEQDASGTGTEGGVP